MIQYQKILTEERGGQPLRDFRREKVRPSPEDVLRDLEEALREAISGWSSRIHLSLNGRGDLSDYLWLPEVGRGWSRNGNEATQH